MKILLALSVHLAIGAVAAGSVAAAKKPLQVKIDAGNIDRNASIVWFDVPKETAVGLWRLVSEDEKSTLTAQVTPGGHAVVFVADLKAGVSRTFKMERDANVVANGPTAARDHDNVQFSYNDRPILRYDGGVVQPPPTIGPEFARGGYIHPVMSPSGKLLTDDFPANHKHHHGIWAPWTHTEFEGHLVDFWNMGLKLGRVEYVSMEEAWSGPLCAGLEAKHRFVDLTAKPEAKPALNETWDVIVYRPVKADQPYYVFDLIIHQECATATPLLLPKYHYGGLGVRGAAAWDVKGNCFFLTSEGKDRGNGNETRGRWCRMSGKINGSPASISILDHPSNFRYPEPMRLNPTEPFFCYAPSQLGEWKIEPGKPYDARYRFVAADGETDPKELDRLWNDWGNPPTMKVAN